MIATDVWHVAAAMIDQYGAAAAPHAASRAAEYHLRGDMRRQIAWQWITDAIVLFQSDRRDASETVH